MVKSKKIYKNFNINPRYKNSIILIGNFDGVHKGHQKLFSLAKKYKKKYSSKIGVLTFEPMPKMFFNKNLDNFRISNLQQKIDNLKNLNVDFLIIKKFDRKFSKIKSITFIKEILSKKLIKLKKEMAKSLHSHWLVNFSTLKENFVSSYHHGDSLVFSGYFQPSFRHSNCTSS